MIRAKEIIKWVNQICILFLAHPAELSSAQGSKHEVAEMLNFSKEEEGKRKKEAERKDGRKERKEKGKGEKGLVKEWGGILRQKKTVCKKKRRCMTCYQEEKWSFEPYFSHLNSCQKVSRISIFCIYISLYI